MNFIKKHLGDIIIFIGVFAVFFLSGTPKKNQKDLQEIIQASEVTKESINPVSAEVTAPQLLPPNNQINQPPNINNPDPKAVAPTNLPPPEMPANNNPYSGLMNLGNSKQNPTNPSIQNSLQNLKGEAPSTEALIERNSYFKKLSEQLKDLKGNVNTDEEKPNDLNKVNEPSADEETSDEELEDELDENPADDLPAPSN